MSHRLLLARLLVFVALTAGVLAQGEVRPAQLDSQAVEARLNTAKESTSLSEGERAEVVASYTKALEAIKAGDAAQARAKAFTAAKAALPADLAEARRALAAAPVAAEPEPSAATPLAQMEQSLLGAEETARLARAELAQAELQLQKRSKRQPALPELIAAARGRLTEAASQFAALPAEVASEPASASNLELLAARYAAARELAALEAEQGSYDGNQDLLVTRRDLAARGVERADKLVKAWQQLVQDRRAADAKKDEAAAAAAVVSTQDAHPLLVQLAKENERLAKERTALAGRLKEATDNTDRAVLRLAELSKDFKDVSDRVTAIGLTDAMGALLRDRRSSLPLPRNVRRRIAAAHESYTVVQLEIFELHDRQAALRSESLVDSLLVEVVPAPDGSVPDLRPEVAELLATQVSLVDVLATESSRLFDSLVRLDTAERKLLAESLRYADFVNQRVLWIRSTTPLWQPQLGDSQDAFVWLVSPSNWATALLAAWQVAGEEPVYCTLACVLWLLVFASSRRVKRAISRHGEVAVRGSVVAFAPTAWTVVLTMLAAMPGALLLWLVGTLLHEAGDGSLLAKPLGNGLRSAAMFVLAAEFLRQVVRAKGLAESHFGWDAHALRLLRRTLPWLMAVSALAAVVVTALEQHGNIAWKEGLGRLVMLVALGTSFWVFWRVLHPRTGVGAYRTSNTEAWSSRVRSVWFVVGIGTPAGLLLLSILGYHFTTVQLALRMAATVGVLTALLLVHAVVLRGLVLARRKMAMQQAVERRKAAALLRAERGEVEVDEKPVEEPGLDVGSIAGQTRSLVRSMMLLCIIVGVWVIWIDVLPALGIFSDVGLWEDITLAHALLACIVFVMTFLAARNIPGVLHLTILQRLQVHEGERHAITTIARYAIMLIGVTYGFATLGLGWGKLQWLAAGISVGLGFGLQEIFANFISGLIILFERPVRVGDLVTVGGIDGYITRIQMRATTIRDYNRKEVVIPNKEFITGSIVNWTLSDATTRLIIRVGIAYGSDTMLARQTLLRIAADDKHVLETPKPKALFMGFGDSTLNFELRVFTASVDVWPEVIDGLHRRIDDDFRKEGIEIAFPQRDLHLRTAEPLVKALGPKASADPDDEPPAPARPRE